MFYFETRRQKICIRDFRQTQTESELLASYIKMANISDMETKEIYYRKQRTADAEADILLMLCNSHAATHFLRINIFVMDG